MERRAFLQSAGTAAAGLALEQLGLARSIPHPGSRPNVLFILPDEWRAQALGCMGNPDVRTPHLDALASQGTLFRTTFANTPVCCPARADILTGTYASKNGMIANDLRLREDILTIADHFAEAGYHTGYIGKWHLDGGPRLPGFVPPGRRRHGFQYWAAHEVNHNYFYNWYFRDTDVPIISEKYEPEFWTDRAVEFLNEHHEKPFFLMLAPGAPHDPYVAPEKYLALYDPQKLTMEPNWIQGTKGGSRKDIAGYYASITAIDDQMGRLFKTLRDLGQEENTIVLFSSDHGNMLGSQGKILKRKPWEESIRVPGIMRYPKHIPSGRTSDAIFSHVDFAPTLLALCGIKIPENTQGTDLSQIALGKTEQGPDFSYFQLFGPYHMTGVEHAWRGLRTERYMYARYETGPWVLYDLKEDPYEMNNLVGQDSSKSITAELDAKLLNQMKKIGDSWSLDWSQPIEDDPSHYEYRTFYTVQDYLAWARQHPQLAPMIH